METCNYGDQAESILRDRLVVGVADQNLLSEKDVPLQKAVKILRACEASRSQLGQMQSVEPATAVVQRLDSGGRAATGNKKATSGRFRQGQQRNEEGGQHHCRRQDRNTGWTTCYACRG